jgi:signal transduction histidine kinase
VLILLVIRRLVFVPLAQLQDGASKVELGNLGFQVKVLRSDEIGLLTKSFNEMARSLQTRANEREQLITNLQAAKRLAEENSRLKSEFLSTMSHELRTPMNAIEGFTSIILNRMGGVEFNDETERYITRVNINSKRLLQLINDFLDLSRVESGRLELAHQPFSPAELARRWQAEISVLAEKKDLDFELTLDAHLPEKVYGDEEAVSKVALNLLSNAIKFTEEGKVSLTVANGGDNWRITVSDTGIGIPPHAREYVFEEFRQVDSTSKRKYGGTGLGLAIVQKYTRTMGGTVTLQSEVGKGSTFILTLPLETQLSVKEN